MTWSESRFSGGITARLRGPSPRTSLSTVAAEPSLFSQTAEEAFLFMGHDRPLVCVTVTADTLEQLRTARDAASGADLVELRLDSVRDPRADGALAGRTCPVIVTCRPAWEGGRFRGSEEERLALLEDALTGGAEYVDVEAAAQCEALLQSNARHRVILSLHDFEGVPRDLAERVRTMRARGTGGIKIAVTARALADSCRLLELSQSDRGEGKTIWIGMGLPGLVTRVLARRFGSAWTYAGDGVAPGQIPYGELVDEFRFRAIDDTWPVYGVVGSPIGHSLSPAMHNAAFRTERLDGVYLPLAAVDVDDFLAFARTFGLKGASVTTPFKVEMAARADDVDDLSRRVGAINTVRLSNGRIEGRNTDVEGFLTPLRPRVDFSRTRAAVLGTGGAARAVVAALGRAGADVCVYGRRIEAAQAAASVADAGADLIPPDPGSWDLLVNTTSAGMFPRIDDTPFAEGHFDGPLVYDLVYNPSLTRFLRDAAAAGCETIGGLDMLVEQAALQFEWWTGCSPDRQAMRAAATSRLAQSGGVEANGR